MTAFSTAPSGLYGIYGHEDHLSSLTITIVYAVYAAGVVVTLLLAGHVSDWYGRRTVLTPALSVAALAAVVFLLWHALGGLIVARVFTGLAVGAAVATATAFIADLGTPPGAGPTARMRSSSLDASMVSNAAMMARKLDRLRTSTSWRMREGISEMARSRR